MTPARESLPLQPSEQSLSVIDAARSHIRSDDSDLEAWTANYLAEHRLRLGTDLDLALQRLDGGARVLDVGAAPLVTTAALQASGFEVCAIDLDPERFRGVIADLGLDVRRCDIETEPLPVADASMDAVVFNELFEHLRIDPIFTLGEVLRVLRPGGVLLLSTPNLRSFRGIRNLVFRDEGHAVSGGVYRQYDKLRRLGHMGHVREYTVTETCDFLQRVGFEVAAIVYRGGHGQGPVGVAERLMPSLRPFFSVVAHRPVNVAAGLEAAKGLAERS
jgi:SAM-dependent methyltransferase